MSIRLLIGGKSDGRRMNVLDEDRPYLDVPHPERTPLKINANPAATATIKFDRYKRMTFAAEDYTVEVYTMLPPDQTLFHLIQGYRRS